MREGDFKPFHKKLDPSATDFTFLTPSKEITWARDLSGWGYHPFAKVPPTKVLQTFADLCHQVDKGARGQITPLIIFLVLKIKRTSHQFRPRTPNTSTYLA